MALFKLFKKVSTIFPKHVKLWRLFKEIGIEQSSFYAVSYLFQPCCHQDHVF